MKKLLVVLLMSWTCCYGNRVFLSPVGYTFELIGNIDTLLRTETFISFSKTAFVTTVYTDVEGERNKSVSKGKWRQQENTIFLTAGSRTDTATIFTLTTTKGPFLLLQLGGKKYRGVQTNDSRNNKMG